MNDETYSQGTAAAVKETEEQRAERDEVGQEFMQQPGADPANRTATGTPPPITDVDLGPRPEIVGQSEPEREDEPEEVLPEPEKDPNALIPGREHEAAVNAGAPDGSAATSMVGHMSAEGWGAVANPDDGK